MKRTVRARKAFVVRPGETANIPISYQRPNKDSAPYEDRDYLFEPQCAVHLGEQGGVFAHLVDASFSFVQVHNATVHPVDVPRRTRLGTVVEYNQQGCYLATPDEAAAVKPTKCWLSRRSMRNWKAKIAKAATIAAYAAASIGSGLNPSASTTSPSTGGTELDYTCKNGVNI